MEYEINGVTYASKLPGLERLGDCVGCIAEENHELCLSLDDCFDGREDIVWVEK